MCLYLYIQALFIHFGFALEKSKFFCFFVCHFSPTSPLEDFRIFLSSLMFHFFPRIYLQLELLPSFPGMFLELFNYDFFPLFSISSKSLSLLLHKKIKIMNLKDKTFIYVNIIIFRKIYSYKIYL